MPALVSPGVKQGHACSHNMFGIAGHKGEIVMQRGGRQQAINNGQGGVACTRLCGETRPAVGDVVIDRQDSVGEARDQFTVEPRFQSDASTCVTQASRAWQICRMTSRARSATSPRNTLYRYFVIQIR